MDNKFEYIIYIVLGLVFVLAQVAKKKKKAAAAQSSDNEGVGSDGSKSPTSFIEQLLGIPEQKPVVRNPAENDQLPPESLDPSFIQSVPRVSTSTQVNESSDILVSASKTKPAGYQRKKAVRRKGFDLRTAVIYKAVLERKNF